MKLKYIYAFTITLLLCCFALGCSKKDDFKENVVITVNETEISIDQAKFYAYNKQANYEVYYLVSGAKLDWKAPYDKSSELSEGNDITMETLVKKEVLDQIKKVVLVSEYAKDEGITLNDNDSKEIDALVEEFIADSKDKLITKIGKDKSVLTTVFTRQKYIDKLYEKLDITDNADAQDDLYKELLSKAKVMINEELWATITFDEAIYTEDDVEPMED